MTSEGNDTIYLSYHRHVRSHFPADRPDAYRVLRLWMIISVWPPRDRGTERFSSSGILRRCRGRLESILTFIDFYVENAIALPPVCCASRDAHQHAKPGHAAPVFKWLINEEEAATSSLAGWASVHGVCSFRTCSGHCYIYCRWSKLTRCQLVHRDAYCDLWGCFIVVSSTEVGCWMGGDCWRVLLKVCAIYRFLLINWNFR